MGFIKLTLITFGVLYVSALSGMYVFQRDFQYFPSRHDPLPEAVGLTGVERILLTTPDGETLVLWYAAPAKDAPVILFLHGNGGEMADRADRFAFYQARGYGVLFLSWRGYGGSSGQPSETGLLTDAKTAYDCAAWGSRPTGSWWSANPSGPARPSSPPPAIPLPPWCWRHPSPLPSM
jgi:uncharacterized protein